MMTTPTTTVLLAACVVTSAATAAIAYEPEPTSIQCQGKATSPVPGPWGGRGDEVSLFATINYEHARDVVLVDSRSGQIEVPFRQDILGVNAGPVPVRTGSITVEKGSSKLGLKVWRGGNNLPIRIPCRTLEPISLNGAGQRMTATYVGNIGKYKMHTGKI
jgi:hypothetical protein